MYDLVQRFMIDLSLLTSLVRILKNVSINRGLSLYGAKTIARVHWLSLSTQLSASALGDTPLNKSVKYLKRRDYSVIKPPYWPTKRERGTCLVTRAKFT